MQHLLPEQNLPYIHDIKKMQIRDLVDRALDWVSKWNGEITQDRVSFISSKELKCKTGSKYLASHVGFATEMICSLD